MGLREALAKMKKKIEEKIEEQKKEEFYKKAYGEEKWKLIKEAMRRGIITEKDVEEAVKKKLKGEIKTVKIKTDKGVVEKKKKTRGLLIREAFKTTGKKKKNKKPPDLTKMFELDMDFIAPASTPKPKPKKKKKQLEEMFFGLEEL